MKIRTFFLSVFALALLASACVAPPTKPLERGDVDLGVGESVLDVDTNVKFTFVEVVNDSRCPADAICVTSGFVQVLLRVTNAGGDTYDYTLTLGDLAAGDVNRIILSGYKITLRQVDPYPLASQPTDPADYRITLSIS